MSCSCFSNKTEIYQYTTSTDFIIGHDSKLAFKSFSQLKTHIKKYIKVGEIYKLYDFHSRKVTKCKRKAEFRVITCRQTQSRQKLGTFWHWWTVWQPSCWISSPPSSWAELALARVLAGRSPADPHRSSLH